MKTTVTLHNEQQGHAAMLSVWREAKANLSAGCKMMLTLEPQTRSLEQNAVMWSCLQDLSDQVEWCGKKLTKEAWKEWISGHLVGQELIPNMHGTGFISITGGKSTSKMSIKDMIALIDLCHAFGTDKGVVWSPTSC